MAYFHADTGSSATQGMDFWKVTTGTIGSNTDAPDSSKRAIKCTISGASLTSTANQTVAIAKRGMADIVYDALPDVAQVLLLPLANTAAADILAIGVNSSGNIIVQGNGTTAQTGTSVTNPRIPFRISWAQSVTSTTNWILRVWLNGKLEVITSNVDGTLGATAADGSAIYVGKNSGFSAMSTGIGRTMNVWIRAWLCDDTASLDDMFGGGGVTRVFGTAKRPNANGTNNQFTTQIGSGGSGYGTGHSPQVNERPLSTSNGWSVVGAGSVSEEDYNGEDIATGDDDATGKEILAVVGWADVASTLSETPQIVVDGTYTNISTTSTAKIFFQPSATPTVYPARTGKDIGVKTDTTVTTVSLYEAGFMVFYRDPVPFVRTGGFPYKRPPTRKVEPPSSHWWR